MLQLVTRLAGRIAFAQYYSSVRVDLNSSALSAAEYDTSSEELTIDFMDGDSRTYSGVPSDTFFELVTAGSPGGYFNANIRNSY
jgi:hypothetical protein